MIYYLFRSHYYHIKYVTLCRKSNKNITTKILSLFENSTTETRNYIKKIHQIKEQKMHHTKNKESIPQRKKINIAKVSKRKTEICQKKNEKRHTK
jgi:hypothetical protein